MAIRRLDEKLFEATVGPATLVAITSVMSDADKARWLDRYTSWPKPEIGRDGLICVPDPDGSTHYISHSRVAEMDVFACQRHGGCWGTHAACREYKYQSGIEYEESTGQSIFLLQPSRGD